MNNPQLPLKIEVLEEAKRDLFNPDIQLTHKTKIRKELFLMKIPLFSLIYQKKGQHNFRQILNHIKMIKTEFGETVFEGEDERSFNYILRGSIMLFVKDKQEERGQAKFYQKLNAHQYFGQKMIYGKNQLQSARSSSVSYLLQLDMPIFYTTFAGHFQYNQLKDRVNFLKMIWVFANTRRPILQRVFLSSETKKYQKNHILFKKGDELEFLYVILTGEVTLYNHDDHDTIKFKPFCILNRGQVCGLEQIMAGKIIQYSGVCTTEFTQILKIQKTIFFDVIQQNIPLNIISEREQINSNLRKSQISYRKSFKILNEAFKTTEKRYKTQQQKNLLSQRMKLGTDKMEILNKLFNKQIQLKEEKIRKYKLESLKLANREVKSRLSTYTNNSQTLDREIIIKYLDKKQRVAKVAFRKEIEYQSLQMHLIPELNVTSSSAVKNHKRKLKNSRRQHSSTSEFF